MDGDRDAGQGTARDQERLRRLARLHRGGAVASLIAQLGRDSSGGDLVAAPGIEYALSALADEAAAAGLSAHAWQAQQTAWVNAGPWPWVAGSAPTDTLYDPLLAPVRALLRDPAVAPIAVGQAAVRALYPALLIAGGRAYGLYGRGVVLVDLRPAAETAVSYLPGTLLAASDTLLPPYIPVQVMIEAYDPERAVLVVVHTTPLFMIYRLDRTPGAPPPDAPLIDFDQ